MLQKGFWKYGNVICPLAILGTQLPACLGQGNPAGSPAVPVVLPILSETILGSGAAQAGPWLQLSVLE